MKFDYTVDSGELQQQYSTAGAASTAPDPPTHPPKDRPFTAAARQGRATAVHEFGDADVILLLHLGIYMFLRSPAMSGIGGGSFRRTPLPARGVWRWGLFFRRRPRGLLCGAGVARSRGLGRSRGARESRPKTRHSKTDSDVKIQSETTFVHVS